MTAIASGRDRIRAALVLAVLISALICAAKAGGRADTFVWSSIQTADAKYEKGAILVTVQIAGVKSKLFAQLDTGADATIFYGRILRKMGVDVDSASGGMPPFRWFGHEESSGSWEQPAFVDWSMDVEVDSLGPSRPVVGTVGLDKVVGKILVLDFPHRQYAVLTDTGAVSQVVSTPVGYVNAAVSYNKLFVSVVMGPDTIPAVRYDCGASTATLILPLDWWQWATGLKGDEGVVVKDTVQSWGVGVETWTAPAKYDLFFGGVSLKSPRVTFVDWPDPTLRTAKLLGNAPFYDDYVVVVDCIRQKLGVARGR